MIFKWWRKNQRLTDMNILWPTCKKYADDLDHAKAAFYTHCVNDAAWTKDYDEQELIQFVSELQ